MERVKDRFDGFNNRGCPLQGDELSQGSKLRRPGEQRGLLGRQPSIWAAQEAVTRYAGLLLSDSQR